jgi:hypothetical protein
MTFSWDRTAPELRDAKRLDLILHDQTGTTTHALDRKIGTLVIPYTPQTAVLRVDDKRYTIHGSEPSPAPPAVAPPDTERKLHASISKMSLPMVLSNRGRRVVSTAAVVLPQVPSYVQRRLDVDLLIKVNPRGKVASVASNYRSDPLRKKLSAVASTAIARWQFDRIAVNSYREGKIRIVFTPQGVSVSPAPVG